MWACGSVAFDLTTTFRPLFLDHNGLDQIWSILDILGTTYSLQKFFSIYIRTYEESPLGTVTGKSVPSTEIFLENTNLTLIKIW